SQRHRSDVAYAGLVQQWQSRRVALRSDAGEGRHLGQPEGVVPVERKQASAQAIFDSTRRAVSGGRESGRERRWLPPVSVSRGEPGRFATPLTGSEASGGTSARARPRD